ncbi:MAG: methyltransferase family protein [Gemmatirosa sp.]
MRDAERGAERGATGQGSAGRIVGALVLYALVHSVLASRAAKDAAARVLGPRTRGGWYRAFYNAQAVATTGALVAWAMRQPDRTLYEVRGPLAALMRAGQLAGLALGAAAVREIGLARVAGATDVARWARGDADVPPEAEAQGPAPDATGRLRTGGPFALVRHPLNLMPIPVLWLNPRMTVNLAVGSAVATAYLVLGSWHEERRLSARYGEAYEAYRHSGVPFVLPL